jgi:hypothetical protein
MPPTRRSFDTISADNPSDNGQPPSVQRKILWLMISAALAVFAFFASFWMMEELDAGVAMVIQYPTGRLAVFNTPGPKLQMFGKVTKYKIREQFWFDPTKEASSKEVTIRFNDGGHAEVSGSIAWEIPTDEKSLLEIHQRYRTQEALEKQLIQPVVEKAVYMTGPLMSSSESYAARRQELIGFISDQISHGIYRTESKDELVDDQITQTKKTVKVVTLVKKGADYDREERSPLDEFHVKVFNLSISNVKYSDIIEKQIAQQQSVTAESQQQQIIAKTAQQKTLTSEQEGKAEASKKEWAAKAIAAELIARAEAELKIQTIDAMKRMTNLVIEAQGKLEVAELAAKEAEQFKQAETLKGEGEAARRKAALEADNALEKKLQTYEKVNVAWAESFAKYQGAIVPGVVMGGSPDESESGFGNFQNVMQMVAIKAAKDLNLDTSVNMPQRRAESEVNGPSVARR